LIGGASLFAVEDDPRANGKSADIHARGRWRPVLLISGHSCAKALWQGARGLSRRPQM
jgi:hypothetical protein